MAIKQLPKFYNTDFRHLNKKPVGGVEIDWSNPLTKGLVSYFKLDGDYATDLVAGGNSTTFTGTPPTFTPKSVITSGGADSFVNLPIPNVSINGFGFIVGGRRISGSVSLSILSPTTNNWTGFYLEDITNGRTSNNNSFDGAVNPIVGGVPFEGGNKYAAYSISSGDFRGVANGGSVAQDTGFSLTSLLFNNIVLGASKRFTNTDNEAVSEFLYIGVYNRVLTDSELKQLSAKPYQILKPKKQTVYSADAGGGSTPLSLDNIINTSVISDATLSQNYLLTVSDLLQNSNNSVLSLIQRSLLSTFNISSSSFLGQPNLLQANDLIVSGVSNTSSIDSLTLTQLSSLNINDILNTVLISLPNVAQKNLLSLNSIFNQTTLSVSSTSGSSILPVSKLTSGVGISIITLIQRNLLTLNSLLNNTNLASTSLFVSGTLNTDNIKNINNFSSINLSQKSVLSSQSLTQGLSLSSCALLIAGVLNTSNIINTDKISNVDLSVYYSIVLDNLLSSNSLTSVDLDSSELINTSDISSLFSLDNVDLNFKPLLVVGDLLNNQSTQSVIFYEIPLLNGYSLSFSKNPTTLKYSVDLIKLKFGE